MEKNIDIERAITLLKENVVEKNEVEELNISEGLGKILAQELYSSICQPPFSKSAMDGYALNSMDLKSSNEFIIQGYIYAGDNFQEKLLKNHCCRIMTGGKIPDNCDIVIKQEECEKIGDKIKVLNYNLKQKNICYCAEEYEKGNLLIRKGKKLDFIDLGILSAGGVQKIFVKKMIKIALLVTGDEVVEVGKNLEEGKIFDANGMLLKNRLEELGYPITFMEYLKDDELKIKEKIKEIAKDVDLIITTGGVSVGDKDIFHNIYTDKEFQRIFWRVNLKPGTPVMFGKFENTPILSLSGNPFASLVTFELLGRVLISLIQGDEKIIPKKISTKINSDFLKSSDKKRFVRGKYDFTTLEIPKGLHTSSSLINLQDCNVLVEIPPNKILKSGDNVEIWIL